MISRITQFFIDRYQLTVVLFLMLAVMGWASWGSIPKAEDPAIPIPTYIVVAVYPGAQPAVQRADCGIPRDQLDSGVVAAERRGVGVPDRAGHRLVRERPVIAVGSQMNEMIR